MRGSADAFRESLDLFRGIGDKWALTYLLEDVGALFARCGQAHDALRLAGAADTLRAAIGAPLSPAEVEKLTERLAPARSELTGEAQTEATAEGREAPLDAILEQAARQLD